MLKCHKFMKPSSLTMVLMTVSIICCLRCWIRNCRINWTITNYLVINYLVVCFQTTLKIKKPKIIHLQKTFEQSFHFFFNNSLLRMASAHPFERNECNVLVISNSHFQSLPGYLDCNIQLFRNFYPHRWNMKDLHTN